MTMIAYERLLALSARTAHMSARLFRLPTLSADVDHLAQDPVLRFAALLEVIPQVAPSAEEPAANADLSAQAVYALRPLPFPGQPAAPMPASASDYRRAAAPIGAVDSAPQQAVNISPLPQPGNPAEFTRTLQRLNLDPTSRSQPLAATPPGWHPPPPLTLVGEPAALASPRTSQRRQDTTSPVNAHPIRAEALPATDWTHPDAAQTHLSAPGLTQGKLPEQMTSLRRPTAPPAQEMRLSRSMARLEAILNTHLHPQPPPVQAAPSAGSTPIPSADASWPTYAPMAMSALPTGHGATTPAFPATEAAPQAEPLPAEVTPAPMPDVAHILEQIAEQLEFDLIRTYGTSHRGRP
jgi:hypothetical protein